MQGKISVKTPPPVLTDISGSALKAESARRNVSGRWSFLGRPDSYVRRTIRTHQFKCGNRRAIAVEGGVLLAGRTEQASNCLPACEGGAKKDYRDGLDRGAETQSVVAER